LFGRTLHYQRTDADAKCVGLAAFIRENGGAAKPTVGKTNDFWRKRREKSRWTEKSENGPKPFGRNFVIEGALCVPDGRSPMGVWLEVGETDPIQPVPGSWKWRAGPGVAL
jgi:hypothetical protein